jgi:hypothetical protein
MTDSDRPGRAAVTRRGALRTIRGWFRLSTQYDDVWSDLTENLTLPVAVRTRLTHQHPEIDTTAWPLLDTAFWQWVRIRGRNGTLVVQPSAAVDAVWKIYAADHEEWAALPSAVTTLPYVGAREPFSVTEQTDPLRYTHRSAHFDEIPYGMPALFRADEELGIAGGRLYTTECTRHSGSVWWQKPPEMPERICLHASPHVLTPSSQH